MNNELLINSDVFWKKSSLHLWLMLLAAFWSERALVHICVFAHAYMEHVCTDFFFLKICFSQVCVAAHLRVCSVYRVYTVFSSLFEGSSNGLQRAWRPRASLAPVCEAGCPILTQCCVNVCLCCFHIYVPGLPPWHSKYHLSNASVNIMSFQLLLRILPWYC